MVDRPTGLRIEMNLARQARDYAKDHRAVLPEWGAEVLAIGSGYAVWGSEGGAPNVSRVFALGLEGSLTADDLLRAEELFDAHARHGDRTRVVTSPWTHASLFDLLARRGYRVIGHDNVLTRALADVTLPAAAPGVTVARVGQARAAAACRARSSPCAWRRRARRAPISRW